MLGTMRTAVTTEQKIMIFEMTTNGTCYLSTNTEGDGYLRSGGQVLRREELTSFQDACSSVLVTFHLSVPSRIYLWESQTNLAVVEMGLFLTFPKQTSGKQMYAPYMNPKSILIQDGWGKKTLNSENTFKWRICS